MQAAGRVLSKLASETHSCRYLHKVARDPLSALTNDKNRAPAREHSWYGGNQNLNMTFKYIVDTIINIKCVSKRNRKNDKTTVSARGRKQPGRFAPYHTPSLYASSLSPCAAECMQVEGSEGGAGVQCCADLGLLVRPAQQPQCSLW